MGAGHFCPNKWKDSLESYATVQNFNNKTLTSAVCLQFRMALAELHIMLSVSVKCQNMRSFWY